jgi:hypothetical protein
MKLFFEAFFVTLACVLLPVVTIQAVTAIMEALYA